MGNLLLDSDAVIDFLGGIESSVQLIRSLAASGDTVCVCGVVVAEVYSGVRPEDRERVSLVLAAFAFLTTTPVAARQAGIWRYSFARRGVNLATSDVLVAATAHAHRASIVTGNLGHYPMSEVAVTPLPRSRDMRDG